MAAMMNRSVRAALRRIKGRSAAGAPGDSVEGSVDADQSGLSRTWRNAGMGFRHILVPTDGPARSRRAIATALGS
jgi:hypothetical protein